jgi:hypothetical protein
VYASDATNVLIDINGYFAPVGTGGLSLYTLTPCRVLDSRLPSGTPPLPGGFAEQIAVEASTCSVPLSAEEYVLNATIVPSGFLNYLTLWPQGETLPNVSTLNARDGAVTSNMAIVPTLNGSISAYPSDPTYLIIDISSYFAP